MNNSKLISLLRSMPPAEIKSLRKWVKAHGHRKDAFQLFQYLIRNMDAEQEEKLSKEKIFAALFPGKKFNDLKLRYMSFELLGMCEDFIVFDSITQQRNQYQFHLLQYYRKHNLAKFFEQTFSSLKETINDQPQRDGEYFFVSMRADGEYNKYLKSKQNRAIEPNIQHLSDDLDMFYLLNKLKIYSEALNYKNILKVDYNIRFVDQVMEEIGKIDLEQFPALKIHYFGLMTLMEPGEEEHFHRLKTAIDKHKKVFSEEELRDLYVLARNYCIKKINLGNKKFARELFELYQWELEVFNESGSGELSPAVYKNMITLAFLLNELEWIFHFVEDYTGFLPEEHRESYYNFNMANYHFKKKNYDKVIDLLAHVEYSDVFIQLGAKALLLKTYFELREYLPFDSLLHSFSVLLKNKKALGYHRDVYFNFIRYCKKLFFPEHLSARDQTVLKKEISERKELAEKEWLLEKLHQGKLRRV